jgi:hypothetical protein
VCVSGQVTLPMLRGFGVGNTAETSSQLDVTIKARGALPLGGGIVDFKCPVRLAFVCLRSFYLFFKKGKPSLTLQLSASKCVRPREGSVSSGSLGS